MWGAPRRPRAPRGHTGSARGGSRAAGPRHAWVAAGILEHGAGPSPLDACAQSGALRPGPGLVSTANEQEMGVWASLSPPAGRRCGFHQFSRGAGLRPTRFMWTLASSLFDGVMAHFCLIGGVCLGHRWGRTFLGKLCPLDPL